MIEFNGFGFKFNGVPLFTTVNVSRVLSLVMNVRAVPETSFLDPLLVGIDLSLSQTYYPAGFPVSVTTNSQDVLEAASESWGHAKPKFGGEPIKIRAVVQPEGELSQQPTYRCQRHLLALIAGPDNFAVADLNRLFGFLLVSARTAADHLWLRWFFLESIVYTLLEQRHVVAVHAACIARHGKGILLCGAAGAGKSTLCWACARSGWTLIGDDCAWLLQDSRYCEVAASSGEVRFRQDAVTFFPELKGFIERARPNGKLSLQVPLRAFPEIKTTPRCMLDYLVFLNRGEGRPGIRKLSADYSLHLLVRDHPTFGPETEERHERAFRNLASLPAYQLCYQTLEDGQKLLESLTDGTTA